MSGALFDVPDLAEAVQAWRVWRIVGGRDGYRLGSVVKPTVWPPGEALVAECLRPTPFAGWFRRSRGGSRLVPDPDCACGIYAAPLSGLHEYLLETPAAAVARVLGRVSLWGTVIECERGFRASHAYPLEIFVPADALGRGRRPGADLLDALERYDVPVERLPAGCSEAIRLLEQRSSVAG